VIYMPPPSPAFPRAKYRATPKDEKRFCPSAFLALDYMRDDVTSKGWKACM
jgi:hypothetical protein